MENKSVSKPQKIKRKKFFLYFGVSVMGVFGLSKLPFKIFQSRNNKTAVKASPIKVEINPLAVKRTIKPGQQNG
ncbi:MAG TPA: hypothetical protein VHP32_11880 [Ignavibacteria bacterium]|nr:hypothetical protein [Ignavibacteria bacterium]